MKRILLLILIGVILFLTGCDIQKPNGNGNETPAYSSYKETPGVTGVTPKYHSYKDIPGVTSAETDAIESLRAKRTSFVYGMNPSSEAFYTADGTITGFSSLFCGWLSELFGISFKPAIFEWGDLVSGLSDGKIDFTGELTAAEERKNPTDPNRKPYFMTDAITERTVKIMRLAGSGSLSEIAASRPLKYAFLTDATTINDVSSNTNEKFESIMINDYETAYALLKSGEIDGFVDEGVAEAAFDKYNDVVSEDFTPIIYSSVSMTTQEPELAVIISVVQKALENENVHYFSELYKQGYQEYLIHKLFLQFTDEEREYIENHPVISFAAEFDNYPVSFYNKYNNEWQGIAFDVLSEVTKLTGLSFKVANAPNKDFSELMQMLETGKVSIISELIRSEEREGRFLWPENALFLDRYALISKWNLDNIQINDILHMKVGLKKDTAHAVWFKKSFPTHEFTVEYDNTDEVFEALDRGDIDLMMSRMSQLLTLTNYHELTGYKDNYIFDVYYESTFGFNKDEPVLCSIIDKTLPFINCELISSQWMNKNFDYNAKVMQARLPWLIGASALLLLVIILLVVLFIIKHREKKRLESLVWKRTSELENASRAKSDFLSNMSHEIRTPMNAIIGMTNIGKSAADIERKDYSFGKIEDASKHLLGIINDILDMSKIEAGKFELAPVEFDFERVLQRVVNVVNFRVDEKKQKLTVYIDRKIPQFIIGDEQRLAQIITNLLGNAVKFTPEEGSININTYFSGEENGICKIKISVRDTGIGISREQQTKLFQSFQQAESSTARKFGGTGLGLSISKNIVEMMGGEIWIESEIGKGSAFIFTVQMKRGEKQRRVYSEQINNWKDVRILVVDDDEYILKDFKGIVGRLGAVCDTALNADEALRIVEQGGEYDIYFVDWRMPDIDGIELIKRLRSRTHASGEPLMIMISAVESSEIAAEAKEAGVDKFLQKPLFPSAIADIISEYLGVTRQLPKETEVDVNGIFKGRRILLAEDVEINREIVLALLEPTEIEIDCAVNGDEAVRMFTEAPGKYEIIFMDVQMPEMDGYEATSQIRSLDIPEAKTVPIIAMTANVFREDIEKCLEAGMDDHIGKPLDLNTLFEKLNKYLTHHKEDVKMKNTYVLEHGIVWSDSLLLGDARVDTQHQKIFELVNDIINMCENGSSTKKVKETLNFMVDYAVGHFADEEALQLEYNYPEYEKHKQKHEEFKVKVNELVQRFNENGSSAELSNEINSFLVRWLVDHIQEEDKKIGEHIRKVT